MNSSAIKIIFVSLISVIILLPLSSCKEDSESQPLPDMTDKILFELDFSKVPATGPEAERMLYQGKDNAHEGGGYLGWLGGALNKPYGDGTQDIFEYQNIHMSSESAAQGAMEGHTQALKCHWASGYSANFERNHIVVSGWEDQRELYIAFMFRFGDGSGNFKWPFGQIKFAKIKSSSEPSDPNHVSMNWKMGKSPSGNGNLHYTHIPQVPDGGSLPQANIWAAGFRTNDITIYNLNDDYNNGIGPNGEDEIFEMMPDIWYHLETRIKLNSENNSDGLRETWINGVKIMGVENINLTGGRSGNLDKLELFHIMQIGSGNELNQTSGADMPGFMGGKLIVSTERIGLKPFGK